MVNENTVLLTFGLGMDSSYTEDFLASVDAFNVATMKFVEEPTVDDDTNVICVSMQIDLGDDTYEPDYICEKSLKALLNSWIGFTGASTMEYREFLDSFSVEYCLFYEVSEPIEIDVSVTY